MLAQPVKTIPAFHGTRGFLTVFPITRRYPEPDESRSSIALCKTPFNINLSSTPPSPMRSLLFGFPTKISRLPCALSMSCSHPPPRFDHGTRVHTLSVKLCNRLLLDSHSCIDVQTSHTSALIPMVSVVFNDF